MPQPGKVAFAIPQTIATSDFRCSLGGSTRPEDACTIDMLSSTVSDCRPLACMSISLRQSGKDQRRLAMNQMAAIELCADRDGQPQLPHRRSSRRPVWNRSDEIAAKPDEHLGAAIHHRLYGVDDMVPASPRRLEAEDFLELVQQCRRRLFINAHG